MRNVAETNTKCEPRTNEMNERKSKEKTNLLKEKAAKAISSNMVTYKMIIKKKEIIDTKLARVHCTHIHIFNKHRAHWSLSIANGWIIFTFLLEMVSVKFVCLLLILKVNWFCRHRVTPFEAMISPVPDIHSTITTNNNSNSERHKCNTELMHLKSNGVHKKIEDITEHSGELLNAEFDNGQTNGKMKEET